MHVTIHLAIALLLASTSYKKLSKTTANHKKHQLFKHLPATLFASSTINFRQGDAHVT